MFGKDKDKGSDIFKFNLGDEVTDNITGFSGVVIARSQWLHNCNTYGVQPKELKDGQPLERQSFDEPALILLEQKTVKPERETGGPAKDVSQTNR